jgi:heme ABC exporter ATP-binding subunit CcmA
VVLEGANGAGKTSLLRVIAGLVPVASGRLSVFGLAPVRRRTEVRRRIGLLSHASNLYDDLTVRENVTFAVRAARGDPSRVEGACDRLGLTGRLLRTTAAKLSAGQRRRVSLAVLTARWPDLWLLDEPHATLDSSGRRILDELIAEAVAAGSTVLVASHEAGSVQLRVERVLTMAGGRVVAERRPGVAPPSAVPLVGPIPHVA